MSASVRLKGEYLLDNILRWSDTQSLEALAKHTLYNKKEPIDPQNPKHRQWLQNQIKKIQYWLQESHYYVIENFFEETIDGVRHYVYAVAFRAEGVVQHLRYFHFIEKENELYFVGISA